MFYKPIVSLVAGLAVVGSAAAATTPVARGDGGYPPPTVTPINQCNTGPVQCCNTYTSTSNPVTSLLAGPLGLGGLLDPALGVGISCLALIGGNQW
jgi:Fungal hydrophobin